MEDARTTDRLHSSFILILIPTLAVTRKDFYKRDDLCEEEKQAAYKFSAAALSSS